MEAHEAILTALEPLVKSLQEVLMQLIPGDQQMLYNFILPEYISAVVGKNRILNFFENLGTTIEFVKCDATSDIRAMHRHFDKKNSKGSFFFFLAYNSDGMSIILCLGDFL